MGNNVINTRKGGPRGFREKNFKNLGNWKTGTSGPEVISLQKVDSLLAFEL